MPTKPFATYIAERAAASAVDSTDDLLLTQAGAVKRADVSLVAGGVKTGDSTLRPTNPALMEQYNDTTLGIPIFWSGTQWTDALGQSIIPVPTIPAFGSYVTPGSVGIPIANRASLVPFVSTGALNGTVTVTLPHATTGQFPTTTDVQATWQATGLQITAQDASVAGADIQGPLRWSGSGVLYLKDCIIDACCTLAGGLTPANLSTGYNTGGLNDGSVPATYGEWHGNPQGYGIWSDGDGLVVLENCTIRATQKSGGGGPQQNAGIVHSTTGKVDIFRCDMSGVAQGGYPLRAGARIRQCVMHDFHNVTTDTNPAHFDGSFVAGALGNGGDIEISQNWMDGPRNVEDAGADNAVTAAVFVQWTGNLTQIPKIKVYGNRLGINGGFDGSPTQAHHLCIRNQNGLTMDVRNNEFVHPKSMAVREAAAGTAGGKLASYLNDPRDGTLGNGNLHTDLTAVPLNTPTSGGFNAPAVPGVPTNVTALVVSSTRVDVTWLRQEESQSYVVERSPNGTTGWSVLGTPVTEGLSDTTVTGGNDYYYRVSAVNWGGTGSPSTVVHVNTGTVSAPPGTPSGLSATAISSSEIDLDWTDTSTATSYIVERSPDGTANWTQIDTPATSAYADLSVAASTQYFYRVAAVNQFGQSAFTSSVNATTPSGGSSGLYVRPGQVGAGKNPALPPESSLTVVNPNNGWLDTRQLPDNFVYENKKIIGGVDVYKNGTFRNCLIVNPGPPTLPNAWMNVVIRASATDVVFEDCTIIPPGTVDGQNDARYQPAIKNVGLALVTIRRCQAENCQALFDGSNAVIEDSVCVNMHWYARSSDGANVHTNAVFLYDTLTVRRCYFHPVLDSAPTIDHTSNSAVIFAQQIAVTQCIVEDSFLGNANDKPLLVFQATATNPMSGLDFQRNVFGHTDGGGTEYTWGSTQAPTGVTWADNIRGDQSGNALTPQDSISQPSFP